MFVHDKLRKLHVGTTALSSGLVNVVARAPTITKSMVALQLQVITTASVTIATLITTTMAMCVDVVAVVSLLLMIRRRLLPVHISL